MQNIPIALAAAEMVLAKEIRRPDNPSGPPICGKGVILSLPLIMRLRDMGVQTVTVEGHPVVMPGDKPLEEQLEQLDRRFRKVMNDPLMVKLKEIYRDQIIRAMGVHDG
jgi:hypothetical protein